MVEGDTFYYSKKFKEALVCFEKALEIEPKNALCWKDKALTLSHLDKVNDAEICFEKALEIEPKNVEIWQQKANFFLGLNDFLSTIDCLNRLLEVDPTYVNAWCTKGIVFLSSKKYKDALNCLDEALKIEPNHLRALKTKTTVLCRMMDFDSAKTYVDKILTIDPNNEDMQEIIEFITDTQNSSYQDNSQFEESEKKSDFNYYEILGASRNDTQEEIKQKYKDLSLKFHPDKAKSALSEDIMKQVNEAFVVLGDIGKRRQYDSELD